MSRILDAPAHIAETAASPTTPRKQRGPLLRSGETGAQQPTQSGQPKSRGAGEYCAEWHLSRFMGTMSEMSRLCHSNTSRVQPCAHANQCLPLNPASFSHVECECPQNWAACPVFKDEVLERLEQPGALFFFSLVE